MFILKKFGLKNKMENQNLNVDIKNYIDFKMKKRNPREIKLQDNFKFNYGCCLDENAKKFKVFHIIENELNKKIDIIRFLKKFDKLNATKKIILNKNQSFTLENKSLKVITHKQYSNEFLTSFNEIQNKQKEERTLELISYLNKRQNENAINDVDKILLIDMECELRDFILSKFNFEP